MELELFLGYGFSIITLYQQLLPAQHWFYGLLLSETIGWVLQLYSNSGSPQLPKKDQQRYTSRLLFFKEPYQGFPLVAVISSIHLVLLEMTCTDIQEQ